MPQKAFIWLRCISSSLTNHPRQPAENTVQCMITTHQHFMMSFFKGDNNNNASFVVYAALFKG